MSEDVPFFSDLNMTIIGLGLMGGSLALALKGHCKKLAVVDNNEEFLKSRKRNENCRPGHR